MITTYNFSRQIPKIQILRQMVTLRLKKSRQTVDSLLQESLFTSDYGVDWLKEIWNFEVINLR